MTLTPGSVALVGDLFKEEPTAAELVVKLAAIEAAARVPLVKAIEDHWPQIRQEISDRAWLMCSCGWDSDTAMSSWPEHILALIQPGGESKTWDK